MPVAVINTELAENVFGDLFIPSATIFLDRLMMILFFLLRRLNTYKRTDYQCLIRETL